MANRTISLKNAIFANNAAPELPPNPVANTAYRNASATTSDIGAGWPFFAKFASGLSNEVVYRISGVVNDMERGGIAAYSANTDYVVGGLCRGGTSNKIFKALQASGPNSGGAKDPDMNNPTYWSEFGSSGDVLSQNLADVGIYPNTKTGTSGDLNTYTTQGFYFLPSTLTLTNNPAGTTGGILVVYKSATNVVQQMFFDFGNIIYFRIYSTSWQAWGSFVTSSQLSDNSMVPNHAGRITLSVGTYVPQGTDFGPVYQAPSNGVIWGIFNRNGDGTTDIYIKINTIQYRFWSSLFYYNNSFGPSSFLVKKGDQISMYRTDNVDSLAQLYFIPSIS